MRLRGTPFLGAVLLLSGLAWADERSDAERDLEKAAQAKDRGAIATALAAATKVGDARAAKVILKILPALRGCDVHDEVLGAIKAIKDEAGVKELADASKRPSTNVEVRYILVEGLAYQGSPLAAKAVHDGLDDKDDLVSTIAARGCRRLGTPETVEKLIARLEKAETKPQEASLKAEILGALTSLTGESLSFALEWKGWWMSHKAGWKPKSSGEEPSGKSGGSTVVERLKKQRPEDARTVERLANDDVIVVKGKSDKIADVFKAINIKCKEIEPKDFATFKLEPTAVLVMNCNSDDNPYGEAEFKKIREFVEKGGYLFCSDWQLDFLLAKAFPEALALDKKVPPVTKGDKNPMTIKIEPADPKHPFLRDVFPLTTWDASGFTWKLDPWSMLPKLVSEDVTVLVKSPDLEQRMKNGAVAVTFRFKNGKIVTGGAKRGATGNGKSAEPEPGCVLHVLGHFKHQKDKDSGDKFALQQLLLNFLVDKQKQRKSS